MVPRTGRPWRQAFYFAFFLLTACGGGGSNAPAPTYSIGGAISGLSGSVVLQDNGGDDLTVSADGNFTFPTKLDEAATYHVTVLTQPTGQLCTVNLGSGSVSGSNVTNVAITCAAVTHTVGFTVSGLVTGTLQVKDNSDAPVSVTADGSYVFPVSVAENASYDVKVVSTPSGYGCSVTHGSGTMGASDITDVTVSCAPNQYKLGGTVSNLDSGKSVTLQNNLADDLTVSTNGVFNFSTAVPYNTGYEVTVSAQPTNQQCGVTGGKDVMPAGDVSNVTVDCVCNPGGAVDKSADPGNCGSCGNVCSSKICVSGACQSATCTDSVQNGSETDVDCGGSTCVAQGKTCALTKHCGTGTDCSSGACNVSTLVCVASTCLDGKKDGNETDIDCGGTCTACANGKGCLSNTDCAGGSYCDATFHTCVALMGSGGPCSVNAECASGVCDGLACQ